VHFIHSWSAVTPDDRNTVGGRWLSNGVYAYVGSVDEPYVQAFVTPHHLQILTPFLIAARQIGTLGKLLLLVSVDDDPQTSSKSEAYCQTTDDIQIAA